MKNQVREIWNKANRNGNQYDNRQRATKTLNEILSKGDIRIEVCEEGQAWYKDENPSKKWNLEIKGFGYSLKRQVLRKHGGLTPHTTLICIVSFLKNEKIREKIGEVYAHVNNKCERCNGRGIIPQFHYYMNGICFDCYGTGLPKNGITIDIDQKLRGS